MKLTHEIIIDNYIVTNLISVKIRKSISQISDRATIRLPLRATNSVYKLPPAVVRGASVNIILGYDGENVQEFSGYIAKVKQGEDLEITCEDWAFLLRVEAKNKQYKKTTLGNILEDILQDTIIQTTIDPALAVMIYDDFIIKDATIYEIVEKIAEDWNIHIYLRENVLYASLKYALDLGVVKFDTTRNIEKLNLEYQTAEEREVTVEMVGINKKNVKTSVVVGSTSSSADKIKLVRYNVSDLETLRKIANEELKKWSFTGYSGSITTWLLPYVTYGNSVEINNKDYPDRVGRYHVDAVDTEYTSSGGSRKVTIGIKV